MTTINSRLKNRTLYGYRNGNYKVHILDDGTKIRFGSEDSVLNADFPESIDLKITDYCDLGCPFCHEKSTKRGKHGNKDLMLQRLQNLSPGVELAIGGGNPLDFPDLVDFLYELQHRGFICNMTVNSRHLAIDKYKMIMADILNRRLIYGLGISGTTQNYFEKFDNNVVNHFIIGEQSCAEFYNLATRYDKILLLGYKMYGRGENYSFNIKEKIARNTTEMQNLIKRVIKEKDSVFDIISFDNLAIEQLNLKDVLTSQEYNKFFMGEDGRFTMYYDGVTDTFARSSVSSRNLFANDSQEIRDVFKKYVY